MHDAYAYVWEFEVPPEAEAAFRREYGPQGSWAALFRRDPAYIETLLLQDRGQPGRFLTVDRWRSAEAFHAFKERFGAEYAEIDRRCEALTHREALLGTFVQVDASPGRTGPSTA